MKQINTVFLEGESSALIASQINVYNNFNYLLHDFDQPWRRPVLLQEYSRKIHEKRAPCENCFGFIDLGL